MFRKGTQKQIPQALGFIILDKKEKDYSIVLLRLASPLYFTKRIVQKANIPITKREMKKFGP